MRKENQASFKEANISEKRRADLSQCNNDESRNFGADVINIKRWVPVTKTHNELTNNSKSMRQPRTLRTSKRGSKGPINANKEGSPFQWSNNPFGVLATHEEDIHKENIEPINKSNEEGLKVDEEVLCTSQHVDSMDEVMDGPQGQNDSMLSQ